MISYITPIFSTYFCMLSLIILFFWHIMSSWTLRLFVRTCVEEWFRIAFYFFSTPCHSELDSGSHLFLSKSFWFFSFFISSLFLFFHKNYYHFTKGKEPARSPKPAVSFPLNPFLLGHGLRRCLKNLPTSEKKLEVRSVSYEQIRVAIFFFQKVFDSFLLSHHVILNSFQDLTFIFSKWFLILFFLISSLFLFFYKNYYHFT